MEAYSSGTSRYVVERFDVLTVDLDPESFSLLGYKLRKRQDM